MTECNIGVIAQARINVAERDIEEVVFIDVDKFNTIKRK